MLQETNSHPTCLVVLGMHRSGTSVLTGTLGLLGATLPTDLLEADPFNAKGHFESKSVLRINDEMLQALGTAWYDLRGISPTCLGTVTVAQARAKLKEAIQGHYGDPSLLVLKDPRFCRFFPTVRSVIDDYGALPRVVFCFRNPLDVAYSLKTRDGIALQHGLGLWLRHMLDGEFHSRGLQRVFIDFADFLRNWHASIERIELGLGIALARGDEAAHEVEKFIEAALCHHSAGIDELEMCSGGQGWVRSSYEAFGKLVLNPNDRKAMRQLDLIRAEFEDAASLIGAGIQEYYAELSALRSVKEQIDECKGQLDEYKGQLKNAEKQLEDYDVQLQCATRQLQNVQKQAKQTKQQLRAIRRSRSWRVTAPIRSVATLLRRVATLMSRIVKPF
jgi:hypothetical protein